jgi:hypothetical protein
MFANYRIQYVTKQIAEGPLIEESVIVYLRQIFVSRAYLLTCVGKQSERFPKLALASLEMKIS